MAVFSVMFNFMTVILFLVLFDIVSAFNLSPKPNIVVREPKSTNIGRPKVRSSYFGFSLSLKRNRY